MPHQQATNLLSAKVTDSVGVLQLRHSFKVAGAEPPPKSCRFDKKRFLESSFETFRQHENGMIAGDVIGLSILEPVAPASIRPAGGFVLSQPDICEGPRGPTMQVRFHLVDGVPAGCLDQWANFFPAFSAVYFCGPANVKRWVAN